MLCDRCKKNTATLYSKTIINGVESNENLCSECAKKLGKDYASFGFGLFDMFNNPISRRSLFDIDFFDDDILTGDVYLEKNTDNGIICNALNSVKKGISKFKEDKEKEDPKLIDLKQKLKNAVECEDYEKAAELKKQIQQIEEDKKGE